MDPASDALQQLAYRYDSASVIDCGLEVDSLQVVAAMAQSNRVLAALPLNLFTTIDLKTQSGIVGAVFAAELATRIGALPNPIEKGHPDIVPLSAAGATEAELRNYPVGLEIKSTLGGVAKGSALSAGHERVGALVGIVWQAHHRDVRSLMGLVWDFVDGAASRLRHPALTAAFYSGGLLEEDWGQIAGTTGRNTKVTGMTVSGRRKMAAGAVAVLDDARHLSAYARCLGVPAFGSLDRRTP